MGMPFPFSIDEYRRRFHRCNSISKEMQRDRFQFNRRASLSSMTGASDSSLTSEETAPSTHDINDSLLREPIVPLTDAERGFELIRQRHAHPQRDSGTHAGSLSAFAQQYHHLMRHRNRNKSSQRQTSDVSSVSAATGSTTAAESLHSVNDHQQQIRKQSEKTPKEAGKKGKKTTKKSKKAKKEEKPEMEKPKRPFSAYNLFFQLEREYILQSVTPSSSPSNSSDESEAPEPTSVRDPKMPARYRNIVLPENWYDSQKKAKRKHRKTKGAIGFIELTRMISTKWATIDEDIKKYCKDIADTQLEKYKEQSKVYKEWLAKEGEKGQQAEEGKKREREGSDDVRMRPSVSSVDLSPVGHHHATFPLDRLSQHDIRMPDMMHDRKRRRVSEEEHMYHSVPQRPHRGAELDGTSREAFDREVERFLNCLSREIKENVTHMSDFAPQAPAHSPDEFAW